MCFLESSITFCKNIKSKEVRMIDEAEVRTDLREWRKREHAINVCLDARSRMQRPVELLLEYGKVDDAERVKQQIASLKIDKLIADAQSKREMYIQAIERLDAIDKIVVVENIINGKTYWRVAQDTAYSVDAIRWRAKRVARKLCAIINKKRVMER